MKIITSPAKLMNTTYSSSLLKPTKPKFIKEAEHIQTYLKEKDPKYLAEFMEISSKLADENWERNQLWTAKPSEKESAPAIYAFVGEVYRGLDAKSLDKKAMDYLEKNYRILSGLYGLLKPSDRIMLYRLEIGRNFEFEHYKNLYDFWGDKITNALNEELNENELILNLASNEYGKVLNKKKLKGKWIDFSFYEMKSGKPKTIVVYTKHARGMMVRFCAENNVQTLDEVKAFNNEGYLLDEELSSDSKLVFTR